MQRAAHPRGSARTQTTGEEIPHDNPQAELAQPPRPARSSRGRRPETIEILEALLLAIVAIATALSGYQATKWDGLSTTTYVTSSRLRTQSNEAQLTANQTLLYNSSTLDSWLQAKTTANAKLASIFAARFTPTYKAAFDAWVKLDPLTTPGVPIGPAYMPHYKDPLVARAKSLSDQSAAAYNAGAEDRSNGDGYVRVTVMLAAVLFLLAVGQRFRIRSVRLAMSGVAGVFPAYSIILLISYPHA